MLGDLSLELLRVQLKIWASMMKNTPILVKKLIRTYLVPVCTHKNIANFFSNTAHVREWWKYLIMFVEHVRMVSSRYNNASLTVSKSDVHSILFWSNKLLPISFSFRGIHLGSHVECYRARRARARAVLGEVQEQPQLQIRYTHWPQIRKPSTN